MPKILLIEDDPRMRKFVRDTLMAHGHEVLLAQDGAFGVSMSTLERPDAIILDIMMPVMDGVEALHLLKSEPSLRDIPVVILTALEDQDIEAQARALGAAAFLKKPVDMKQLMTCIEGVLGVPSRKH